MTIRNPFPATISVGIFAALSLIGSWSAATGSAAGNGHRTELGLCRVPSGTGICRCSLSSIETELTFSEAAGVVELYYRGFPDERYTTLLISLLHQCSGDIVESRSPKAPSAIIRQHEQASGGNIWD
jgi:hypothetical protein